MQRTSEAQTNLGRPTSNNQAAVTVTTTPAPPFHPDVRMFFFFFFFLFPRGFPYQTSTAVHVVFLPRGTGTVRTTCRQGPTWPAAWLPWSGEVCFEFRLIVGDLLIQQASKRHRPKSQSLVRWR